LSLNRVQAFVERLLGITKRQDDGDFRHSVPSARLSCSCRPHTAIPATRHFFGSDRLSCRIPGSRHAGYHFLSHQCFDGAASAAYLGRFFSTAEFPCADLQFVPVVHSPASPWDEVRFDADENAIVDFKYADHPRVTWWFDHERVSGAS
jgi:hypothetical protein